MQQFYRKKTEGIPEKKDVATVITNRIIEQLEAGTVPWKPGFKNPGDGSSLPRNGSTNRRYNGVNILTLWGEQQLKHYDSNRWYTMAQVNTLGGRVRKGERGTPVVFRKEVPVKENGVIKLDKKGRPETYFFWRYTFAWNLNQTTITITADESENQIDPATAQGAALDLLMAYIAREKIEFTQMGDLAYYSPDKDAINLPKIEHAISVGRWFEAGFHEATHSTGHSSRLSRPLKTDRNDPDYSKEELIAELGSAFLMGEFGIFDDALDNMAAYIGHWLGHLKANKNLIFQASSRAQVGVTYIRTGVAG